MNFCQMIRDAIERLTVADNFAGSFTKKQVIAEAAAPYRKSGYVLDSLRLDRAAGTVLREQCLSSVTTRDGHIWTPKDLSEQADFEDSATYTQGHCEDIQVGGIQNAATKRQTGTDVAAGIPWHVSEADQRQARRADRKQQR